MSGGHGSSEDTRLVVTHTDVLRRLEKIRAVVCDWDGVFNDGFKDLDGGSPFSEVDSMGVNLLRFAIWMKHRALPFAAVITGQHNAFAERFAPREKFHGVYMGFTNKPEAFDRFLATHGLKQEQVLFVYDDVLDLPVAERCGLRVLIGHRGTQRFQRTCIERRAVDVLIPLGGGHHGLREACELLIDLLGQWGQVIDHRVAYSSTYQEYLTARNAGTVEVVKNAR